MGSSYIEIGILRPERGKPKALRPRAHAKHVIVEVSGGITLATIGDYARAGADLISVGAMTHSAPAVDIGLDVRT